MEGWLSRVLADVGRRAQRPKILQARTTSRCRVSSWLSKARNLTSVFMQLRIDASASVLFCKRALRALYALANSNRSVPFSDSRALKRTPSVFVFSDLHGDPVQTKEVATLGDDLPSKRNRRILLATRAEENSEQLRTGKRLRTLRQ